MSDDAELRAAVEKFLSTHYPNNGDGRTSHLTWTIPEKAFGDLRCALDLPANAVPVDADRKTWHHWPCATLTHAIRCTCSAALTPAPSEPD